MSRVSACMAALVVALLRESRAQGCVRQEEGQASRYTHAAPHAPTGAFGGSGEGVELLVACLLDSFEAWTAEEGHEVGACQRARNTLA